MSDFPPPTEAARPATPPGPMPPPPGPHSTELRLYGRAIPPSPTKGLRTATLVLFWCSVGASWLLVTAAINRRRVWEDFRNGDVLGFEVDDADGVVAGAFLLQLAVAVAGVIVLSIWSLRTARFIKQFRAFDVSPGLACGGWYIPFGNFVVPFVQLRRIAAHRARSTTAINWWQGLFIAQTVAGGGFRSLGDIEQATSADDLSSRLNNQVVFAVVSALLLTGAAIAAVRATRDVDGT